MPGDNLERSLCRHDIKMLPRCIRTRLRAFDVECELAGRQPAGILHFKQATRRPIAFVRIQKCGDVPVPACFERSNVLEIEMQLAVAIGQTDNEPPVSVARNLEVTERLNCICNFPTRQPTSQALRFCFGHRVLYPIAADEQMDLTKTNPPSRHHHLPDRRPARQFIEQRVDL